jgi:hypothetical protein
MSRLPTAFLSLAVFVLLAAGANAARAALLLLPIKDATIYADNANNANGTGIAIIAGNTGGGATRRALLQFDLTLISAGSVVQSATLSLFVSQAPNNTPTTVSLHRLLSAWTEGPTNPGASQGQGAPAVTGDVTWQYRTFSSLLWSSSGGDFSASPTASVTGLGGTGARATFSGLATDVQNWIDNPASNFGWIVRGVETGNSTARQFSSREAATGSIALDDVRPVLSVDIAPIPEPATALLILLGATVLGFRVARGRPA